MFTNSQIAGAVEVVSNGREVRVLLSVPGKGLEKKTKQNSTVAGLQHDCM